MQPKKTNGRTQEEIQRMRRLLKLEANKRAIEKVSASGRAGESTEVAQEMHK